DISVLMSNETRTKEFGIESGSKAATGASVGGAVGGTVGAVLAAIAAVGTSIALPGLGLVIAGPLAAALAGLGAWAATGGLVGGRGGWGVHRCPRGRPDRSRHPRAPGQGLRGRDPRGRHPRGRAAPG